MTLKEFLEQITMDRELDDLSVVVDQVNWLSDDGEQRTMPRVVEVQVWNDQIVIHTEAS